MDGFRQRAAEALDAGLGDPGFDVQAWARAVHAERSHFARRVRRAFGAPPRDVLRNRRLDRAGALLAETALPVGEVAGRCGFASAAHFADAFRRRFGAAPSDWRTRRDEGS